LPPSIAQPLKNRSKSAKQAYAQNSVNKKLSLLLPYGTIRKQPSPVSFKWSEPFWSSYWIDYLEKEDPSNPIPDDMDLLAEQNLALPAF
jgi:hypothetical protein